MCKNGIKWSHNTSIQKVSKIFGVVESTSEILNMCTLKHSFEHTLTHLIIPGRDVALQTA